MRTRGEGISALQIGIAPARDPSLMTMYSASRLLHRAASTQTSMLAVPVLRTIPRAFPVVRTTLFSSSSRSAFASSSRLLDAAAPPMSEGEKALKDKLEANLAGSKVEVQDVSGPFPTLSRSRTAAIGY